MDKIEVPIKGSVSINIVYVTKSTLAESEAISNKMRLVEPKLLGIKLVNYQRGKLKKVWIPYYFLIYDYEIVRNVFFNKSEMFNKKGRVAIIYDANEMHASHYDIISEGEFPLIKRELASLKGEIIPDSCDFGTICDNAEKSIQRQILFKTYKTEGKLEFVKATKFYREACQLPLYYKDRSFIKYAYLDGYGIQNERIRGLRARMDS